MDFGHTFLKLSRYASMEPAQRHEHAIALIKAAHQKRLKDIQPSRNIPPDHNQTGRMVSHALTFRQNTLLYFQPSPVEARLVGGIRVFEEQGVLGLGYFRGC
jgi:hypothetical protein